MPTPQENLLQYFSLDTPDIFRNALSLVFGALRFAVTHPTSAIRPGSFNPKSKIPNWYDRFTAT
ncbi:hypothetical protein [Nostoc sp.]|uniref:hypothetical protein n=1 Tax=Nostoc sp. TaxID=1180 RepID=UPI002FFBD9DB